MEEGFCVQASAIYSTVKINDGGTLSVYHSLRKALALVISVIRLIQL
jgi:hypothetical protein